ncbi:MAG: hypothetical protein ACI9JK_001303 [Phycisphaerales bacterium]|jgi:hypothetical protein
MQNEERINGLETQVRTLKRIVYGFGCLLVAGIVVGATSLQTVPDVIRAKSIQVVNDKGKIVAGLIATPTGGSVSVSNNSGETLASLSCTPSGGLFGINNDDGTMQVALGVSRYGGRLSLHNNKGVTGVLLDSDAYGGRIGVLNKEDMPVAGIRVSSQGSGEILTANKQGKQTSATP